MSVSDKIYKCPPPEKGSGHLFAFGYGLLAVVLLHAGDEVKHFV